MNRGFLRAGHLPTLFAAFLYFDLSFMVWVLLGPLGVQISKALHLSPVDKGLMVAIPVLAGAILRPINGIAVDHFGPRRAGIVAQILVIAGLAAAWGFGVHSLHQLMLVGIVLGLAGASFAIALPLASRWYPPEHQGTAMGIAGAGNSGTVLAALVAPALGLAFGWQTVFGLVTVPMIACLGIFIMLAKEAPNAPPPKALQDYLSVLRISDAWWFMFFYSVTFGGFVGLSSSLTIYFNDQYGLPPVQAGYFTAIIVFVGSLVRPVGGAVADKIGGTRSLTVMYAVAAAALAVISTGLPQAWMALSVFAVAMLALGMGNGAVFQLVPQRFQREIGVLTGLVGMAGGIGGFYLAYSLGFSKQMTGSYRDGFLIFAGLAVLALSGLVAAQRRWRRHWQVASLGAARIEERAMDMRNPQRERLVVVGNGMAGMRMVEELTNRAPTRYEITVFGAEPHPNYDRIALSSVLAGEKEMEDIVIHPRSWYAERGITLIAGDPVTALDRTARTVTTESGMVAPYDQLLLSTGSKPIALPIPGLTLPGVCAFRDIADVETMIAAANRKKRAVVIGGGLLGLEAAWGLKRRGMSVAVVHLMPTLMERQLDLAAGQLLQRDLDSRGIAFFTDGQTEEILGTDHVEGVLLADGREIPADLVVLAIGIRPNIDLAKKAGLLVNRGIEVGDDMRTSDPRIYAVGECIEHNGKVFGLVAPLWDQAKVCAARLAGDEDAVYVPPEIFTKLKITGIDVFSAGALAAADEADAELTFHDAGRGIYKKLVLREDKVVGAVLYGDVADGPWYMDLIRRKTEIAEMRDGLVFGRACALSDGAKSSGPDVASMPDDAQVCGCNGVSKGAICSAIAGKNLRSLDDVRAHTKASASCGQCTPVVQAILAAMVGGDAPSREPALCKCTELSHDEVRRSIVSRRLQSMEAARAALGWKTPDGCAKCRPALNYYLLCAWPGLYVDDSQSRFVNERVHANIQKDGTYSVIPRMWGGLTTPEELRAIADAAERYNIPTVKVTGGQRIDLLGVKKEQLPAVWADLNKAGLVSGHAYGKALRTVKTCVGSEWCRFGTQDSTGLGVKLEKMCWGSWTPHKVKLAVSGCPRNCAEATIKDLGVVCVEAGYDIVVGGNGGIEVRVTDPLARVATEAEVLEYTGAFLQLYREEARYLERTAPWVARVGIEYVRRRVVENAEERAELHRRFLVSQSFTQTDPWAERAANRVDAHEFIALEEGGLR